MPLANFDSLLRPTKFALLRYTYCMADPQIFSKREQEVIGLVLEGKSNKQIALALGIANRTVEFHLGNIYTKLGVSSRAEAILRLSEARLRESAGLEAGVDQRKPTVAGDEARAENGGKVIPRRVSMKNLFYVSSGVLLVMMMAFVLVLPAIRAANLATPTPTLPAATERPEVTPAPVVSSKERILNQIRQLAVEYDQSVQAEKQTGKVEVSKNPVAGEDIFIFRGESFSRIYELYLNFMTEKTRLEGLYTQLYRDELHPTPFPPGPVGQERSYYDSLAAEASSYCSLESWRQDPRAEILSVYEPDEGRYATIYMGEVIARCEIYGQMLEELRTAPLLAKVDREADTATIRLVTGKPDLTLNFDSIQSVANAPGRSAAMYTDGTGTKYYIDLETGRLVQIEPNFPTHPDIAPEKRKTTGELRTIAEAFALANSPSLQGLRPILVNEEGNKGDIYFFRWDYRSKDWSGTDWFMMPPFLQVGLLADGQVVIYLNTLDLVEK